MKNFFAVKSHFKISFENYLSFLIFKQKLAQMGETKLNKFLPWVTLLT